MSLGRNEPGLCGSGKKYKNCCLRVATTVTDSPEMLTWRRLRRAIEGLPITILSFTAETFGAAAVHEAWEEFVLDTIEEYTEFDPSTPHIQIFMPWFFHCRPQGGEQMDGPAITPTRAFLKEKGSRLDPLTRRYLEACLEAPFSFHEIMSSDPGHGFASRDIITGDEHQVIEQSASRSMYAGDILYGQIVRVEAIAMLEACAPCPLPPIRKIELIDLRQSALRRTNLSGAELLRELDCELQRLVFDVDSPQLAFDALIHLAFQRTRAQLLEDATFDADGALTAVELD